MHIYFENRKTHVFIAILFGTVLCGTVIHKKIASRESSVNKLLHNFRRPNVLISEYDDYVKNKINELAKRKALSNDSELVELARQMMDPPHLQFAKLSRQPRPTAQTTAIQKILKQNGGKFIECGGYDGEHASPTLYLERKRGWTGLLVEVDPGYYTQIIGKQRNAYSINACLSPKPYFTQMRYRESQIRESGGQTGDLFRGSEGAGTLFVPKGSLWVPCFPVETLLLALNWTTIDFFVLDVEGFELDVLSTIPWNKVNIKTFSVEYIHGPGGMPAYVNFMTNLGYRVFQKIIEHSGKEEIITNDLIFTKV